MNDQDLLQLADCEDTPEYLRTQIKKAIILGIGIKGTAADRMAEDLIAALSKYFPGRLLYVPAINKRTRDAQIRSEFNGRNYADLAKKYPNRNGAPLSKRQIRRIVEKKDGV